MAEGKREARRVHSAELKAAVVAQCAEPGASVAAVALEHELNANLVHRWRRVAEGRERGGRPVARAEQFVPVPMPVIAASALQEPIRIELRRSGHVALVQWPASQSAQCAAWLRELLR